MTCPHDYANPTRKGRAHYVCALCGVDITMELVMIAYADASGKELTTTKQGDNMNSKMKIYSVTKGTATIAMYPGPQVRVVLGDRTLAHDYTADYQAEAAFFALCKRDDVEQAAREYDFREVGEIAD